MIRRPTALRAALLASLLAGAAGCSRTPPPPPVTLVYTVEGMHCDGCVAAIGAEVGHLPTTRTCSVDLEQGRAEVVTAAAADDAAIRAAITKLGYKVTPGWTKAPPRTDD